MKNTIKFAGLLFALALVAVPAMADVVLPPGATWEYTFTNPTGDASWNTTTGGWATGLAPFGNNTDGGYPSDFNYATLWPADGTDGDDLWLRTKVNLTGFDLSTVLWNLGVDNGFKLYVNGNLVSSGIAEGYTFRWEYSGSVLQSFLNPGVNVVAVALEDHGVLTAFDMQLTANPVPEPGSTLTFLAIAMGAIAAGYRTWKK